MIEWLTVLREGAGFISPTNVAVNADILTETRQRLIHALRAAPEGPAGRADLAPRFV